MSEKEFRKELSKIRPRKFNPKTIFKGVRYNGNLFCSGKCFYNKHDEVVENKLEQVLVASEMTKGRGEIGSCSSCGKTIET